MHTYSTRILCQVFYNNGTNIRDGKHLSILWCGLVNIVNLLSPTTTRDQDIVSLMEMHGCERYMGENKIR